MTWVTGPISVEVHWIECPAARATFDHLNHAGTPYTQVLITDRDRRVLARYGHHLIPTVIVWIGEGPTRHKYMSFDGYNPAALRTIHTLLAETTRAA
jgi:hypothetical protein